MPYTSVNAAPPLPSSFYGTVKFNGENVREGTIIRALINGRVVATSYAMLYQGESVYALDVPGDDPTTTEIEGGKEGDMIRFMLAGFLIKETATWQSGTDTEFNLSLTANATLPPPQPTETPTATQTPLPMPTQTDITQPTPTPTSLATQTPVNGLTEYPVIQPTQTDITGPTQYPITQPTQPGITQPTQTPTTGQTPVLTATLPSMPTASELPSETSETFVPIEATETLQPTIPEIDQPTIADDPETITETNQESRGMGFVIASIIFVIMVAIGAIIFWLIRKKRNEDSGLLL